MSAQLQGRASLDEPVQGEFRVRRLRAGFATSLDGDRIRTKVELNLAPRDLELIEVWGERQFGPGSVRIGVLKAPFTTYRDTSSRALALTEWSPVTRAFGSERQVGAMVAGSHAGWHGALAITQGQSTRTSHGQGAADLSGGAACAWAALDGPACKLRGVAPELTVRVGWNATGMEDRVFDEVGGSPRGAWAVSAGVDTGPDPMLDLGSRVAVEGTLALYRLVLQAGVYGATVHDRERWVPGLYGGRAQVTWAAHRHLLLAGRASWVQSLGRPSVWRRGELVGGVTVPILGHDIRWQLDGGALTGDDAGPVGVVRTMLQLST